MKKEKKINLKLLMIILILFIIVLSFGITGMTYSYYKAKVSGTPNPLEGNFKNIVIQFSDTDEINVGNIVPGWEYTKTITLTNNNSESVKYTLRFLNLVNTFGTGYLKYTVTSADGGCNISQTSVPYVYDIPTDIVICSGVSINATSSHTYSIKFEYLEVEGEDINYGLDQGKSFSGKIEIGKKQKLYEKILLNNIAQSDETINYDSTTGDGFYYTNNSTTYGEDGTKIYYFRGRVENNWVSFAGKLWRIVRTTSEGGVKLVYSGDGSTTSSGFINTATAFNTNNNNKYYVGYTYNTSGYTGTQTNSAIKTAVDTWYNSNLSTYASYLSDTAVYCNDRSSERVDGSNIYYPAFDRLITNKRPTYACLSTNASRYAVSTDTGNGYLTNPISLLTADEINYAGVRYNVGSLNSYIMDNATSSYWFTLSPYSLSSSLAGVWRIDPTGFQTLGHVTGLGGVRPVISLKPETEISEGNGTKTTPYIIETSL